MPKRLSARELSELDPFNPEHRRIIDAEWRRRRAAKNRRRRLTHGWVRVVVVCVVYLALAWLIIGLVYLIALILLAYFA